MACFRSSCRDEKKTKTFRNITNKLMGYNKIPVTELIKREIIRPGARTEMLKRMTELEEHEWEQNCFMEAMRECIDERKKPKYPELNAKVLAKEIDADIIFNMFLLGEFESTNNGEENNNKNSAKSG